MQPFAYARPETLAEVVALLEQHGPGARLLAGGTDLVINLRDGKVRPEVVVDVKRVPELAPGITAGEGGSLVIGATTTMTQLAAHPVVRRDLAALAEGAAVVGSVQIRNRATLAGNLCNASPAADTAPALLVHGAIVVASGPAGDRRIPLDEFFVRSGVTALGPAELVTAIEMPHPARRGRATSAGRGGAARPRVRDTGLRASTPPASCGSRTGASARGRCSGWTTRARSRTRARRTSQAPPCRGDLRRRHAVRHVDARRAPNIASRCSASSDGGRSRPRSGDCDEAAAMIASCRSTLVVNGARARSPSSPTTRCSMSCATISASPARRSAASSANAAPARCSSTAGA